MKKVPIIITLCLILSNYYCSQDKDNNKNLQNKKVLELSKDNYNIFIVMDTIDDWSSKIRDGFKETMDKKLSEYKKKAKYTIFDTELKKEKIPAIIDSIKKSNPDLICTINYPTVFADKMISSQLKDPKYKFVSENCIPIKSGTINSWEKPGGNITGVGVFVQMNSPLRLMKKINPKLNKMAVYSWDQVPQVNEWFKEEITRACKQEGINLVEFRKVPHQEATFDFFKDMNKYKNIFITGVVSAFIKKNGKPANDKDEVIWLRKNAKYPSVLYDETAIQYGNLAGTCVIWYDIGAQLAEKGLMVLKGENPGKIPWDYPRKYNIILNLKRAKALNIKIPQDVINAAYRIYKDYNGNFIGQDK